ncbi:isoflavone reductase family protein [Aspergillus novofumigatus IBT 16806]|uniref:Isoflavone reductase family protein n=1 Tax=Aspergillus novofumigatus (strain IBT 16806) TaxID=1392255 RepID=A0A2I1C0N6_ASPN1|nr:isoflavone reductase family protein [Aspergillus novofumigatus IBT 16806]PKX91141.1 isoflavone reductase family protein [Aspergillus novofumigatus IBT 16806]
MSSIKKVIVVGAGGHLGPHILSAFDTDPQFEISILRRHSSKSTFPSHMPVHRVSDNFDETELVKIFTGQDAVICTIAMQALHQQKPLINAAVKAGVKHFVPSEFGHDTRNDQAAALLPQFYKAKRQIVEYLKSKEGDGLSWTAFVTGPFFEIAVSNFLGFDIDRNHATILDHGTNRWSATTRSTIGLAVKNAMLSPEIVANKYSFIESFNISQNDILASLEDVSGAKWDVTYHGAEEEKRLALEKLAKGNYSAIPVLTRYITCVKGYGGNYMDSEESANKLLSLPAESLREVLAEMTSHE